MHARSKTAVSVFRTGAQCPQQVGQLRERTAEIPELASPNHDRPLLKSTRELRAAQDVLAAATAQAAATLHPSPPFLVASFICAQ